MLTLWDRLPADLLDRVDAFMQRRGHETRDAAGAELVVRGLAAYDASAAGGRATMLGTTKDERSARGAAAANARWRRQAKAALRPTR